MNAKDYRAWSGLGRSYSALKLHIYAIYYNRKSTEIKCVCLLCTGELSITMAERLADRETRGRGWN